MKTGPWPGTILLCTALLMPAGLASATEPEPIPEEIDSTSRKGAAYAHLMRSLMAVRRGEIGAAVDDIHRALELVPDSPDLMTEAAELLIQWTGRESEAEQLARAALELDPEHARATRFLAELSAGRAFGPRRDPEALQEAIRYYEILAEMETIDEPEILEMLIQLQHHSGDREGAVETARRLVAERPGDATAAKTLAQLLLRSERPEEALLVLVEYALNHPFDEELLGWSEQLANSQQAWPAVVEYLGDRRPFPEDHAAIHHFYGGALLRLERWEEGAESLETALSAAPTDLRIRKDLALAYRGMGRLADAAELFEELAAESPEYPFLQQLLAETLAEQRDVDGALRAYGTALNGLSDHDEMAANHRDAIRHRMVRLHLSRGEFVAARSTVEEFEIPDSPAAIEVRTRLAIDSGEWEEARRYARQLEDSESAGFSSFLAGEIAAGENKWSRASSRFNDAIDALGPAVRVNIAEIYRAADRPEQGLELLESWVEQAADAADARFHLGVYYYELDRFEDAERELLEAFRLDPEHARALNFLGYSLAERKIRLDEARTMIERALEIDSWNGAYLDSLGWVHYQANRFEEAREPLERAARELPNDSTVLEHLGDLYVALGERRRALTVWNQALDAGAVDPDRLRSKIQRQLAIAEDLGADTGGEAVVEGRVKGVKGVKGDDSPR